MASWHDGLRCHCLDCDAGRACDRKTQRQRGLPVCVILFHSLFDSRSSCLFQPYRPGFPLDFCHQLDRVRKVQKETVSTYKRTGRSVIKQASADSTWIDLSQSWPTKNLPTRPTVNKPGTTRSQPVYIVGPVKSVLDLNCLEYYRIHGRHYESTLCSLSCI